MNHRDMADYIEDNGGANEWFPGLLYFIGDGEFLKVGFSTDPERRLAALQVGYPKELILYACWLSHKRDEKSAHNKLAPYHARGEWFRIEPDRAIRIVKRSKPKLVSQ